MLFLEILGINNMIDTFYYDVTVESHTLWLQ